MAEIVRLLVSGDCCPGVRTAREWVELGRDVYLGGDRALRIMQHREDGESSSLVAEIFRWSDKSPLYNIRLVALPAHCWLGFYLVPRAWDEAGARVLVDIHIVQQTVKGLGA